MRRLALLLSLLVLLLGPAPAALAATEEAVLAGGCFWCLEHDLEVLPGVLEVVSGFSGGSLERPSYRQVSAGGTGHQEVVRVRFDPAQLSYATLLRSYWRNVDPLDAGGQFCDRGREYTTAIWTGSPAQKQAALASKTAAQSVLGSRGRVVTPVLDYVSFWPAEGYHQDYAEKNRVRYNIYRTSCGRDGRVREIWGR
ncbi:MAG: peptide-methionine (S)-S-oxide reductase [Caulobacteraceae bacterium]|nr:peptide-methionine (S)-S-oxide reductase [Caulobacteraceae bacterium]